jgi:predicted amidohydrolase YtcJ
MRWGIEMALADLAAQGVTSAQDFSPEWENFLIFEELEREAKLTARITEWLPFESSLDELTRMIASHSESDWMLRTGRFKAFMYGSLGGHTAALLATYEQSPDGAPACSES